LLQRSILAVDIPKEVNFTIFHRHCGAVHNQDRDGSFEIHSKGFVRQCSAPNVICGLFRLILEEPCCQGDRIFHADAAMTEITARS
jgi:hypothetical protein